MQVLAKMNRVESNIQHSPLGDHQIKGDLFGRIATIPDTRPTHSRTLRALVRLLVAHYAMLLINMSAKCAFLIHLVKLVDGADALVTSTSAPPSVHHVMASFVTVAVRPTAEAPLAGRCIRRVVSFRTSGTATLQFLGLSAAR
jgi:hypothetical protein